MCDMTHSYVWHDSFICVTYLIHMCDISHSYVWHDSFICVTWLMHMCDMTHAYVWHDLFVGISWLMKMRDMTRSYVRYDSFICMTWLIHTRDMTHSQAWHDSFMCVTCLIHICDIPRGPTSTSPRVLQVCSDPHICLCPLKLSDIPSQYRWHCHTVLSHIPCLILKNDWYRHNMLSDLKVSHVSYFMTFCIVMPLFWHSWARACMCVCVSVWCEHFLKLMSIVMTFLWHNSVPNNPLPSCNSNTSRLPWICKIQPLRTCETTLLHVLVCLFSVYVFITGMSPTACEK